MPFVPAAGIAEVFVEHTFNGKPGLGWVLHFESTVLPWTVAILADLGNEIRAWWVAEMQANMTTAVRLDRIRLRDITSQNSPIYDFNTSLPVSGTLTGQSMPGNVAFSIKKNSGLAGRSFRGRVYQFGFNEADVDLNSIGAGRANSYVAAWNEARLLVGGLADYGMVICSKFSQGSPRAAAVSTPVTSFSYADLTIDTVRNRV
jgi:hypothetical protein